MYFGYHGNQIHCHRNRSHAWLIFADFSRFRDIYPCQDISDILLCFLRPVAMETKCHAWLISTEKVVIGVAKGNPSGDLAIACNCTYSSYAYYYFFPQNLSGRFLRDYSTNFQDFFRNDWYISEVYTLLRFLENSLPVPS